MFGIATALMNTFFFLGLARTDLGKSVAIEFIGPIAVAAAMTRDRPQRRRPRARGRTASSCSAGVEVGDNTVGLLWILAASAMWALYIVVGSRVAQIGRGVAGLGIGLAIGAVVITPIGAPGSADVFTTPRLLAGCVLVGVFSNAIGYGIDQHVLRRIPVRRFSVLLALLPVTAVGVRVARPRPSSVSASSSPASPWSSPASSSKSATSYPLPAAGRRPLTPSLHLGKIRVKRASGEDPCQTLTRSPEMTRFPRSWSEGQWSAETQGAQRPSRSRTSMRSRLA